MRKLVLGLIALTSIQFAFVTYMMVLQSPTEVTQEAAPPKPAPINHEPVKPNDATEIVSSPEPVAPRIEPRPNRSRPVPLAVSEPVAKLARPSTISVAKPAFVPDTSKPAAGDFESVVIRFDRSVDVADCETHETSKPKKRSYIAKAIPVIKKPWDWLKAIGSKLN